MPRWLPRAMVLALVLVGLFQLADWAFHQLIDLFVMLLVAFFLSLALEPPSTGWRRAGCVAGSAPSWCSSRWGSR